MRRRFVVGVVFLAVALFAFITMIAPNSNAGQATGIAKKQLVEKSRPEPTFFAGFARVDITPDPTSVEIPSTGYFDRRATPMKSVHDPLYARAVVIEDAMGNRYGLLSADLCFVNSEVREKVIEQVDDYRLGEHNLTLAATHTHSGFGAYDRRGISSTLFGKFNPAMLELAVDGMSRALIVAAESLEPAYIETGSAQFDNLNRSRRDPAFSVDEGGTKGVPDTEKYPTDRTLTVVQFRAADGRPLGMIYNFSSHATVLSPENLAFSADWPGVTCGILEKEMGEGSVALFLSGSLGDAAPVPDWDTVEREYQMMEDYGRDVGKAVMKVQAESMKPLTGDRIRARTIRKKFDQLRLRTFGGFAMPASYSKIAYLRPDQPIQTVAIGDLALLAVPGEPTTIVGKALKSKCATRVHPIVVAPANGYIGYFVLEEEWAEGGYAPSSCMFGLKGVHSVIDGIKTTASWTGASY